MMNMEITLDALVSLLGLFVGGGGGAFFMWKWQRRKAKAEAKTAEVDAAKELQDLYQQMLADAKTDREDRKAQNEELRQERDHYKNDRNELREQMKKFEGEISAMKEDSIELRLKIQQLNARVATMVPLLCGRRGCKDREFVTISADGVAEPAKKKPSKKQTEIEPIKNEEI